MIYTFSPLYMTLSVHRFLGICVGQVNVQGRKMHQQFLSDVVWFLVTTKQKKSKFNSH